jgi:hypothetical protein
MGDPLNWNGKSRLDRLEGLIERLVTAQLRLMDHVEKLTGHVDTLAVTVQHLATATKERLEGLTKAIVELAEFQKQTDERVNTLINLLNELIRKGTTPPPRSRTH